MPVLARNVVATSQPTAADAGLRILAAGGNAVDAALATAITLTVVEPTSNGIGSDAFAMIWKDGRLHGLNASGRSPATLDVQGIVTRGRIARTGWEPVTTPGAVSSWVEVSRRFGSIEFERLFDAAITYAREGFLVAPQTAGSWARAADRWGRYDEFNRTFLPGGRSPAAGELFMNPRQAETLEAIAGSGGAEFYQGELADRIDAASREGGGHLRGSDLQAHTIDWVDPISIDYGGYTLHEIPPNGQGIAALIALGILQHCPMDRMDVDCADSIHAQIEAMKLAFADAHRYVSDPAHADIDVNELLQRDYLRQRADLIRPDRAQDPGHGSPRPGGTVLLTAADADGCMVSFIQSNYMGFGSGIVIPDTGISLQNRGHGFTVEPGHPNHVGPGKRPFHTIIPGFVTRDVDGVQQPVMAFGVMGGPMQPQGHMQVMVHMVDGRQNPQAALDAPRWRVDQGLRVQMEPGFHPGVYEELESRGHEITIAGSRTVSFGGGQAIHVLEDGYLGASDLRRDGQAVGF
ncbi:MAG: gamma-glutamyltransferase [Phycisphaerae bacterium]|nr:gamma-glutamyltransferase [Phycisphaerae bacterium]